MDSKLSQKGWIAVIIWAALLAAAAYTSNATVNVFNAIIQTLFQTLAGDISNLFSNYGVLFAVILAIGLVFLIVSAWLGLVSYTFEVSAFDGKGQHTTTARSLHPMEGGGLLLDTPGMRELQLLTCEHGIDAVFPDVVQHFEQCRFNNCLHQSDAGCAVRTALEEGTLDPARWERYQQLQLEQAQYLEALTAKEKRGRRPRRR